eukprot:5950021-Amphidinium_carterae.1
MAERIQYDALTSATSAIEDGSLSGMFQVAHTALAGNVTLRRSTSHDPSSRRGGSSFGSEA